MKIAVTGDVHLTSGDANPERFHALENILKEMVSKKIDTLVVAGDLFDAHSQNYGEFEQLCHRDEFNQIKFLIIPGNHDPYLRPAHFSADNIEVIGEKQIKNFGSPPIPFLVLPFSRGTTMGKDIALFRNDLPPDRWVLIGHGDYLEGIRTPNPYEPGIYMPLTRKDLELYRPAAAILGHLHQPTLRRAVYYPGTPCGLHINETGRRRFLVLNTESLNIDSLPIETDYLFLNETIVMLPVKDETAFLKRQVETLQKGWNLAPEDISRVRLRLKVRGYTTDKQNLKRTLLRQLEEFTFYDSGPELDELSVPDDPERLDLVSRVASYIEKMDWQPKADQPNKDDILVKALHTILEN